MASNNFQQGSTFGVQTGGHGYYYYATVLEVDWPCHPKGKRIHHKDSTILDTRRKAQGWQAKEYMTTYSRDRIEGLKPKLEHHPTAGQRQTAVEDLCCCPTCQWAQWADTMFVNFQFLPFSNKGQEFLLTNGSSQLGESTVLHLVQADLAPTHNWLPHSKFQLPPPSSSMDTHSPSRPIINPWKTLILKKVNSCDKCQSNQSAPAEVPLHPWEWPGLPWSRIHIAYAGPYKGEMFFVVVDAYSKWLEVHHMRSTTSTTTI
ncbi:hypothetical protein ACROYT_G022406 [Oculina patagonica]